MSGMAARLGLLCGLAAILLASPATTQTSKSAPPNRLPAPAPNPAASAEIDVAYGAYQRGLYLTAFNEAARRAQQDDPAAMTLLGEIYAQGLGIGRDDSKAAQWYKLAASKGDRDALFALAMFNFQGRAGTRNVEEAARLLDGAAKLGHPGAAYDLGLLYLQGQQFPQDFRRAAELFAAAAEAGNPEAQYALATMYKEGRGVPKDISKAARLMQQVQPKEMARRIEGFKSRGYDPAEVKLILPDATFDSKMTIHLGGRQISLFYLGPGQQAGDTFVAFPHARVLFTPGAFARHSMPNMAFTPSVDNWIKLASPRWMSTPSCRHTVTSRRVPTSRSWQRCWRTNMRP